MNLVSMIEIGVAGGPIYAATYDQVTDENNNIYLEGIVKHPSISLRLSEIFYGTVEVGDITVDLSVIQGDFIPLLTSTALRGSAAIYRLKDLDSGVILRKMSGIVERMSINEDGTATVYISDQSKLVLADTYPKLSVTSALFDSPTLNTLDLNLPLPIILGATREKVPLRYVEENQDANRYRYVVGCDLTTSNMAQPYIFQYPNTIYQALSAGIGIIPDREYTIEASESIIAPDGPTSTGTAAGSLTGNAGVHYWVMTALNGLGETTPSAPFIQDTNYNGSSIGGQVLKWFAHPKATGFRIYRSDDSGVSYGLIKEVLNADDFRSSTYSVTEKSYQYTDIGDTIDTSIVPLAVNTTRGGIVSAVFDRLQNGQSSQLVPLVADIECTEVAKRTDSLGWWLFRNRETRDLASTTAPRLISSRQLAFYDFATEVSSSATFSETTGLWSNGTPEALSDRIGSHSFFYNGTWTNDSYIPGVNGYPAASGFSAQKYLILPSASASDFQFGTTSSFAINALARPNLGTGAKTMRLVQRHILPVATAGVRGWSLGTSEGRAHARVYSGGVEFEAFGTSALDGGWHDIRMVFTRDGTIQGAAPVQIPAFFGSRTLSGKETTSGGTKVYSFYVVMPASVLNSCVAITVATRDRNAIRTPTSVKINGVSLNGPVSATIGSSTPYLSASVWDGVGVVTSQGLYLCEVAFTANPEEYVFNAVMMINMNQGSGTTYRDVTASGTSSSANSSTLSMTTTQNRSLVVDAFMYAANTTAGCGSGQEKRISGGTFGGIGTASSRRYLNSASSTKPTVTAGSHSTVWTLAALAKLAHVAVAYKPLASVSTTAVAHDYLILEVDEQEEARVIADGLATLSVAGSQPYGGIYIGKEIDVNQEWDGLIDCIEFQSSAGGAYIPAPLSYRNGKANQSLSALVAPSGVTYLPYCPAVSASGYNFGTSDFTVEGWFQLDSLNASENAYIVSKMDGSNGFSAYILPTQYYLIFDLKIGGVTYQALTTTRVDVDRWFYFSAAVKRASTSANGYIDLFLDSDLSYSLVLPSGSGQPTSLDNTADLTFGHIRPSGSAQKCLDGAIDELHFFTGLRTASEAQKIWGLGARNPVAQIQALLESPLHGPGVLVDPTSFNTAMRQVRDLFYDLEDPIGADQSTYVTDYTLTDQIPLRDHLAELLKVRGIRLGTDINKLWTISVDVTASATGRIFGYGDGDFENTTRRPNWTTDDVSDVLKNAIVKYRPRRNTSGSIDGFTMQTFLRVVNASFGKRGELPALAIRDS